MTKKLEYPYHTADAAEMQEVVYKKRLKSNSLPCAVPFDYVVYYGYPAVPSKEFA